MSINLGLRHDRLLRKQAAQMFEKGRGYGLTAKRLGVSAATVREWQKMYRVIGKGGLLAMGVKRTRYDYETKVAAAAAVVDGGMSKPEAMMRFGIASATPLKQWCRLYREGGAQALKPKPKGRPKGSVRAVPPTREEELAERVRKLEAQVAYLKKSIALKAQRRSQTGTKPWRSPGFQGVDMRCAISSRRPALPGRATTTHWLTPSSQPECGYVPRSHRFFREPPTGVVTGRWPCACALRKGSVSPIRRS